MAGMTDRHDRAAQRDRAPRWTRRLPFKLPNWWGFAGSLAATWIALGPSFLPRRWWTTAASVSLSQLYGYAVGSGARTARNGALRAIRRVRHRDPNPTPNVGLATVERTWQTVMLSTMVLGTAAAFTSSTERQREIAELVGEAPQTPAQSIAGIAVGSGATALGLIGWGLFRWSSKEARGLIRRIAPALAAPLSGTAVMFGLTYAINRSIVWDRLTNRLLDHSRALNARALPGRTPPTQPERSGSPASYESFNSLGRHGKAIVADGPRADDIAAYWGEPAFEPIRAYVGLSASLSIDAAAKRVVRELKRAGAFERSHLVLFVGTGTGWLSDWSMAAIEFLTRGDCAVGSLQYTVLPSAAALLLDRKSPQQTGQALFREVSAELDRLPPESRPRIYMSGESLGAFGGLSVFESSAQMDDRLHGAVWAGTPQFTPIWRELTARRRPGSPEIRPDVGDGSSIRFSTYLGDPQLDAQGEPYAPWRERRFVFLQHPSDPIVWWNPSLIWQSPTWMREPRGFGVTTRMQWVPWVTFWQVSADMPLSLANSGGYAHRYFDEYVAAWSEVFGIPADAKALCSAIRPFIHPH